MGHRNLTTASSIEGCTWNSCGRRELGPYIFGNTREGGPAVRGGGGGVRGNGGIGSKSVLGGALEKTRASEEARRKGGFPSYNLDSSMDQQRRTTLYRSGIGATSILVDTCLEVLQRVGWAFARRGRWVRVRNVVVGVIVYLGG